MTLGLQLSKLHRKTLFADVLISYQLLEIGENIGKGTYRATIIYQHLPALQTIA